MSYDIYLRGGLGDEMDLPNPTYNLTPIFDFALWGGELPNADVTEAAVVLLGKETDRPRGLRLLSGRPAKETIDELKIAITRMKDSELHEK